MQRDRLVLAGLAAMYLVLGVASPAAAKTVGMGVLSRSQVESACSRAGGTAFGILDKTAAYGCYGRSAIVQCSPDSDCQAVMRDTTPATGNSLDLILLGVGQRSGPAIVKPVDGRVMPALKP